MIVNVVTYILVCDVCKKESDVIMRRVTEPSPRPSGWVDGRRWNRSWSTLLDRHYCSEECSAREAHGLEVTP